MTSLDQVTDWPVPNAAAAVVGVDGIRASVGDLDEPFAIASLSKPLASLATLVAVEEGALELDEPPGDPLLVRELPGATLRHLLAHASGIAPDRRQRFATPGTRRIYSNAGIEVAAEMVEQATGIGFADYLQQAVFAPLGMSGASLPGSAAKDVRAGVADLARMVAAVLSGGAGLLHPSTLAEATSVQFPGLRGVLPGYGMQPHNDWGLGFEIRADKSPHWTSAANSPSTYGHFGQRGTLFWVDPVARLGLVALTDGGFGEWAVHAWPALSDAVLAEYGG